MLKWNSPIELGFRVKCTCVDLFNVFLDVQPESANNMNFIKRLKIHTPPKPIKRQRQFAVGLDGSDPSRWQYQSSAGISVGMHCQEVNCVREAAGIVDLGLFSNTWRFWVCEIHSLELENQSTELELSQ